MFCTVVNVGKGGALKAGDVAGAVVGIADLAVMAIVGASLGLCRQQPVQDVRCHVLPRCVAPNTTAARGLPEDQPVRQPATSVLTLRLNSLTFSDVERPEATSNTKCGCSTRVTLSKSFHLFEGNGVLPQNVSDL